MKKIRTIAARLVLALSLVAVSFPLKAMTMQARDDAGSVVTLSDKACTNPKALAELPRLNAMLNGRAAVTAAQMYDGHLVFQGKQYGACWAVIDGMVAVIDDGGQPDSIFGVPVHHFRPVEGI